MHCKTRECFPFILFILSHTIYGYLRAILALLIPSVMSHCAAVGMQPSHHTHPKILHSWIWQLSYLTQAQAQPQPTSAKHQQKFIVSEQLASQRAHVTSQTPFHWFNT